MPNTILVRFKYASRDLYFDAGDAAVQEGDHVICTTERGTEIGLAVSDVRQMSDAEVSAATSGAALKSVVRVATDDDLVRAEELADKGDAAMATYRRCVNASGLDMKPVGVEYLFDGEKAVCYFAAEERVDFRQLVRELSRELHARVDMRQIGVREEAAVMGGYGHCGQELCCTRFGLAFEPVSIRMAKEQDLPLNSTKISGSCGRLMCCLRYEFEAYRDFKSRAPKKNAVIDTPLGKAKIIEYNTPKEELALRIENGKVVRIALADMTASEAACKKSEELGCACRSDTVTRDVLERLQSPDVQMALAELDRQNGVVEDSFDASDIFVSTSSSRKRSKGEAPRAKQTSAQPKQDAEQEAAPAAGKSRRRRRRGAAAGTGQAPAQAQETQAHEGQPAPTSRRRRHHASASAPQAGQAQDTPAPQGAHARRRPGDRGGAAQQGAPDAQQGAAQGEKSGSGRHSRRRRNRRGGAGGAQAHDGEKG